MRMNKRIRDRIACGMVCPPNAVDKHLQEKKTVRPIAEETVILPEVIATSVVREAGMYLFTKHGAELQNTERLVFTLTDKAEHLYKVRPDIRARFRRDNTYGRDWLYTFMRHWLASELKDPRIPASFANGSPL